MPSAGRRGTVSETHSKQVDAAAYKFERYVTKERWASYWHQIAEVSSVSPREVLEIGVGPRIFPRVSALFNVSVETVDIDPELEPDHVASVLALPFSDGQFDAVVAFQTLEHLPIDDALMGFREMARVARRYVIISLPDVTEVWRYLLRVPKLGELKLSIPRPRFRPLPNVKVGNHYWEVGRAGFSVEEVTTKFERCGCTCVRTYRVFENPYHRFFVFRTLRSASS